MRIRIGIRLDPRTAPADEGRTPELQAELLALVARAESLGADVVWLAESPTAPNALVPVALPLCAAMAARTTRLRIATGLLPLPLHHPLRVAEDASTVDGLSQGRFELGVGLGEERAAYAGFGMASAERAARFEEGVQLIRAAWGPHPVVFRGRYFQSAGIDVLPKPVQPGGPPLWIGARVEAAMLRAARLGAGLLLDGGSPAAFLEAWTALHPGAEGPRIGFLLPPPGLAEVAIERSVDCLRSCSGASQVDLVFDCPLQSAANVPLLLEEIAPRVRSAAGTG